MTKTVPLLSSQLMGKMEIKQRIIREHDKWSMYSSLEALEIINFALREQGLTL